jgi:hypothetical protein
MVKDEGAPKFGGASISAVEGRFSGLYQRLHLWLVARLRNQDEQDHSTTCDDVRKPGVGGLVDKAEQEWRDGQEYGRHHVKCQVDRHGDKLQAGYAQFIVRQQAIENEADAKKHRDDDGSSACTIEAENERGGE